MRFLGLIARAVNRISLPPPTNPYGSSARRNVHTASNMAVSHWMNDEEPVDEYAPTGFHQTMIGDVLGSRYRILRKLGWGVYSTVWLVQNDRSAQIFAVELSNRRLIVVRVRDQSYAALKLMSGKHESFLQSR